MGRHHPSNQQAIDLVAQTTLPVVGAPLFLISNPKLVIAQCCAGIIGSFPALNAREEVGEPIMLENWLQEITEALDSAEKSISTRACRSCDLYSRTRGTPGAGDPYLRLEGLLKACADVPGQAHKVLLPQVLREKRTCPRSGQKGREGSKEWPTRLRFDFIARSTRTVTNTSLGAPMLPP